MLYLVYVEISAEAGTRLDFEEGGPGKTLEYMMNRLAPEAAYAEAGARNLLMVAELNQAQMTELMIAVSKKFDTYPEFTPLIPLAAIPEMAGKAIEEVNKAL
ncbi:MAG: hypothetical protein ACXV45_05585 [Halobacteriota archaeon]